MIKKIRAKSLLQSRGSPDRLFGLKYNLNIYRGCEHKCIYCDSRSNCYQIENFDDVLVKVNAVEKLKEELSHKTILGTIGFGSMSDPYTHAESKFRLTRGCLEVIAKKKFPVHLITKSSMVIRDSDILKRINQVYAAITFTITTVDQSLSKKVEPFAPPPIGRLKAMEKLAKEGIYTGVTMMPILPFIEDKPNDIRNLVKLVSNHGGKYIIPWFGMTLREGQREYFYNMLDKFFPSMKECYIQNFGDKYECNCKNANELYSLFYDLCRKYNIDTKIKVFQPIKVKEYIQKELFS